MKEGKSMEKAAEAMTPVQWMDKSVRCLYLELPESIANDVSKRWEAAKAFLMSPEAARHHLSPVWVKELVDIRNKLYDSLPTGEVKAWDFIQLIKWHLNDIDVFCERFEHPSSLTAVQFAEWMDNSISWTKLTIEKLEVNCFDEDSEMSIRVGKSGYQSLSVDEVKDLANFLISHIKNETESNTDPPVQIIEK